MFYRKEKDEDLTIEEIKTKIDECLAFDPQNRDDEELKKTRLKELRQLLASKQGGA